MKEPEPAGAVFPDTIEGIGVASREGSFPSFRRFKPLYKAGTADGLKSFEHIIYHHFSLFDMP